MATLWKTLWKICFPNVALLQLTICIMPIFSRDEVKTSTYIYILLESEILSTNYQL